MPCTYMKTHTHTYAHTQSYTCAGACTCTHRCVYAHTLIYAHTEGPQCSGHLQYWTQTQAWSLYLHVNGLQQSAAPFVCSVPPAVWAWAASQMGGPHQMGSRGYGAKRSEGRGKRLPAWQPLKQQGLPHSMEVVHGLVSLRAGEIWKGLSKRPSCLRTKSKADVFYDSGKAHSYVSHKQTRWDSLVRFFRKGLRTWSLPCG